jgi:hypothetical protein
MQYLLRLDVEKVCWSPYNPLDYINILQILDIRLFVVGAILSETTRRGDHMKLGERIDLTYDFMDAEDLIGAEMDGRKGRIVVSRELITSSLDAPLRHLPKVSVRGQQDKQPNPQGRPAQLSKLCSSEGATISSRGGNRVEGSSESGSRVRKGGIESNPESFNLRG